MRTFLHKLMVDITRHPRQIITPEWSSKSWTHNVFRAYEYLFGRRDGIKEEMSAIPFNGKTYYYCQSWESVFALAETNIRGVFKWKLPVKVWTPIVATPEGVPVFAFPYLFAIAFDTSVSNTNQTVSPYTFSYTVTGSNPIIVVRDQPTVYASGAVSALTYNSVSLTKWITQNGTGASAELWGLPNCATGSNTVSVTFSSVNLDVGVSSYSGAKATGQPDSSNQNTGIVVTTLTASTTVVANNCWLVGAASFSSNAAGVTGGAGTTIRSNSGGTGGLMADSGGTVATGSQSLIVNCSSQNVVLVIASIAPFVTATVNSGFFFAAAQ